MLNIKVHYVLINAHGEHKPVTPFLTSIASFNDARLRIWLNVQVVTRFP